MKPSRDLRSASIVHQFLEQFLRDETAGKSRSLEDYQQQFPAHSDLIAREYAALQSSQPGALRVDAISHPASGSRYSGRSTIGRGGMGTVLRVFDPTLEREVAMKLLGSSAEERPEASVLQRFLAEAKVTGQLQHPGIIAVHEIGLDTEGRPYFTMPLIEGRSLHEVITALVRGDAQWTQLRVLDVLVRVCETMAYAHERGVIHRDLKPANVMIGGFGETYVVDWGLARVANQPDARDIRIRTHDDASSHQLMADQAPSSALQTMDGDVIGTPAYMAPEQARGEVDRIDARSDVYSIGAMLYHLLAGSAPFATSAQGPNNRSTGRETLARLIAGPPAALSKRSTKVAPELIAICERAMARDQNARYASAAELGAELRAFLENRVVRAYASGSLTELKKWIARNRGTATASAIALIALVIGFAVSLTQKLAADQNAAASQKNATLARDNAFLAEQNALLATENLDLAFEAGEELLGSAGMYDIENAPGSDAVRRELSQKALDYYRRFQNLRGADPRVAEKVALSHFRIAVLESHLGHKAEARAALSAARDSYEKLIADTGPSDRLREKLVNIDTELHILALQGGKIETAIAGLRDARAATEELMLRNPQSHLLMSHASTILHNLSLALMASGEKQEALERSEEKLHICQRLVDLVPQEPGALAQLGSAMQLRAMMLWRSGQIEEAEAGYRSAIEHLEEASQQHVGHRGLRFRLADTLNLCAVLLAQGNQQEASQNMLVRSVEMLRVLVAAHPGVRNYHGHLAGGLNNLAIAHSQQSNYEAALPLFEEALSEVRKALKLDPEASDYLDYRRSIGTETAIALILDGQYEQGAEVLRELVREMPQGTQWTAGRLLAACGKGCANDDSLDDATKSRLVQSYGDESMQYLLDAAEAGLVKPGALGSTVFDLLRQRDDFQALAKSLGQ